MSWHHHYSREDLLFLLRRLADDGLSAKSIAERLRPDLGDDFTRHVVGGLCRRARPRINLRGRAGHTAAAQKPHVVGHKSKFSILAEVFEPVPLMNLRRKIDQCRAPLWPDRLRTRIKVSTSEAVFCGRPTKAGSSYCEDHHALFWMPPQRRTLKQKDEIVREIGRLKKEVAGE